jgi:hypothetical protein
MTSEYTQCPAALGTTNDARTDPTFLESMITSAWLPIGVRLPDDDDAHSGRGYGACWTDTSDALARSHRDSH